MIDLAIFYLIDQKSIYRYYFHKYTNQFINFIFNLINLKLYNNYIANYKFLFKNSILY